MLEERNERSGDRDNLGGRHVHVLDFLGRLQLELVLEAARHQRVDQLAVLVDRGVRLGDDVVAFLDRRQVGDVVGDLAVLHLAVRRLEEAVLVGARVERERIDQPDVRAFRRLDRAYPPVVRRVHVAHFKSSSFSGEAPGPSAETRRLCVISDKGLVWSMNCDSCEEPKNSLIAAEIGLALIRSCGIRFSDSAWLSLSFTARSTRTRPARNWFSASSPTERTRRLPRWSMSSISPRPLRSSTRMRITSTMSLGESVRRGSTRTSSFCLSMPLPFRSWNIFSTTAWASASVEMPSRLTLRR